MSQTFTQKPIHGAPKPQNVVAWAQPVPPVACDFKPGDKVTYTNDYGVKFFGKIVTGFSHDPVSVGYGRFVFINTDCYWSPVNPGNLKHE